MTSTTAVTTESESVTTIFGHPSGLYVCFATEMWERFSFYGMKYLLLLYLTKYHLFSDTAGLDVLGAYAGLVYALPVIGGLLADRYLGMRKAVVFGGILLCLGHLLMAVEGHQAVHYAAGTTLASDLRLADGIVLTAGTVLTEAVTVQDTAALKVFYLALALIIVGVGFLKPNISTIVGQLYEKDDPRRDSGFTIFYMGINIGSWSATVLCAWLGETYGWGYGFGAAGIGMVIGLIIFLFFQGHLQGHAEPKNPELLTRKIAGPITTEILIYLGAFASLAVVWLLVQNEPVVHLTQNSLLVVAVVGILAYSFLQGSRQELQQTFVLMVLIISTIVFWALFEQSAGSMTLYADRVIDRVLVDQQLAATDALQFYLNAGLLFGMAILCFLFFSKKIKNATLNIAEKRISVSLLSLLLLLLTVFGVLALNKGMALSSLNAGETAPFKIEFTAGQFGSLNAFFIMFLAIPFASLWVFLAKRGLEPSTPVKFSLGIFQAGLGFGALVLGAQFPDELGKVSMFWLVAAYLLHTTGELCLSPVGLSAVTKLSMSRVVGVSMGTWFLATALSETVATRIAKLAAINTEAGTTSDVTGALATYTELFSFLAWFGVGVGIFMLVISPLLRKGMHGVH